MFMPPVMLVSPSDLRTVRLECRSCRSAVSLRLDGPIVPRTPTVCPACGTRWLTAETMELAQVLDRFLGALGEWQRMAATPHEGPKVAFEMWPMGHGAAHNPPPPM